MADELTLSATPRMDLGLENDPAPAADVVECPVGFIRRGNDDVFRDIRPGRGEQFLGLVLVDLHRTGGLGWRMCVEPVIWPPRDRGQANGFPLSASGRGLGGGVFGHGVLAKTSPPNPLSEAERGKSQTTSAIATHAPRHRSRPRPRASRQA